MGVMLPANVPDPASGGYELSSFRSKFSSVNNLAIAGDFEISPPTGWTYSGNVLTINTTGAYTISMKTPGTTTNNRIAVASGVTADITLNGVSIDDDGGDLAAFSMIYAIAGQPVRKEK